MTVKREIIDRWIEKHAPNGTAKLAVKSRLSVSLIEKVRLGYVPRRPRTKIRLCEGLGVAESDLFETVSADSKESA
jgi:hypothetical protein